MRICVGMTLKHTFRSEQNVRHISDNNFNYISLIEYVCIFIHISMNFVDIDSFDNKLTLAETVAWDRACDKPFPEPGDLVHV